MRNFQRAHRILKKLSLFRVGDELEELDGLPCSQKEIVGFYNLSEDYTNTLLITQESVWMYDFGWREIQFSEIQDLELPGNKNDDNDSLTITLSHGSKVELPVVGRQGRMRDVYEFARFIRRVVDDRSGVHSMPPPARIR